MDKPHTIAGREPEVAPTRTTLTSVVVASRGSQQLLAQTVRSVLASRHSALQLAIVTPCAGYADDDLEAPTDARVKVVECARRGIAAARNAGVRETHADYIAFTDEGCVVTPTWLSEITAPFDEDDRIGVVFGTVRPAPHDPAHGYLPTHIPRASRLVRSVRQLGAIEGIGASMAVRRSTWLALHGFDERFGSGAPLRACDEIDFVMRALTAGTHVYETMNAAVVHSEFRTWAESPRDVHDHLHGIGAVLVKSLKSRHVGAAAATAGLGLRRLMAKRVAHLGKQPHRKVRLLGLASGVRSGLETPVDRKTGHFQACITAHEGGGPLLDEGAIMHARAEALAKHAIGEVLILDRSPAQLEPNASSAQVERVAIVVPNWNARPFLERALRSLVTHTTHAYELIIVDNGSTDGSKELIREFVRTHPDIDTKFIDHSDNLYFSTAVNIGLRAASSSSKYLALYCNDVEATADTWLQELVNAIQPEAVVAAGHSGIESITDRQRGVFVSYDPVYPDPAVKRHILDLMGRRHATYHHVYGYCVLFKRALLERTGLYLHTGPFRQYHSDWELCLRFAAMGYQIAPVATKVHHWHSVSELLAFHPELYTRLLDRMNDPTTRELDLKQGRPFYEVESGFHSLYSTVFSRTLEWMKRRLRQR